VKKWKTCTLLSSKFIQDTAHQILSKSAEFYRRYDKNIFVYFFQLTVYIRFSTSERAAIAMPELYDPCVRIIRRLRPHRIGLH